ncbi:hypothetical protein KKB55_15860, partial [Myxococcota bacterium]|nr:hypothetical protein [Myxococcota bacterium]
MIATLSPSRCFLEEPKIDIHPPRFKRNLSSRPCDRTHLQLSASLKPIDPPLDPKPGWIMAASGGAALVGSAF